MEENYIRNYLTATVPCGYCGQQYVPDNIELAKQAGNYYTFSAYCHYCNRQNFVTVFFNKGEVLDLEVELTEAEMAKFCAPVCSDDVLDMHTFLKDFKGDFLGLFPDIELENNGSPQKETEDSITCDSAPEQGEGEKA